MDIKDKFLGIWVTREELETIFSLEPVSTAAGFLVAGTVVGDAPGVGLWMELETVATMMLLPYSRPMSLALHASG